MNIADEIALNTMRYKYPYDYDVNTTQWFNAKKIKQTVGVNKKVELGSFVTLLSGQIEVFNVQYSQNAVIEIYKDDESTPICVLDKNNGAQFLVVLPFHKYTAYGTNNKSSPQEVKLTVSAGLIPNEKTLVI